ncbi:MAG TPA: Ig-like domain-containing protein [Vicinamibacterales bacterium]
MKTIRTVLLAAVIAGAGCKSIYDRDVTAVVTGPATVKVGETVVLQATLEYSRGAAEIIGPSTAGLVMWSSSDVAIARVDVFGGVTGVAPGSVTITATPAPGNVDGTRTAGTHAMTVVP